MGVSRERHLAPAAAASQSAAAPSTANCRSAFGGRWSVTGQRRTWAECGDAHRRPHTRLMEMIPRAVPGVTNSENDQLQASGKSVTHTDTRQGLVVTRAATGTKDLIILTIT